MNGTNNTNIIDQQHEKDNKNTTILHANLNKRPLVGMSLLSTKSASLSSINPRSNSKVMPRNNGRLLSSSSVANGNGTNTKNRRLVFLQKSSSYSARTATTANTTSTVSTYLSKSFSNLLGSVVHLRKNKNNDDSQRCSTTQEESSSQSTTSHNKQQNQTFPLIATTTTATTATAKLDNNLSGGNTVVIETRTDELPKISELSEQHYHQQEQSSSESTTRTKLPSPTSINNLPPPTTAESSSSTQQQQQQQDQPPFIPGAALHLACQNDCPVDHVRGLLYMFPDAIDAIDETTGKTPSEVVRDISQLCSCGYCNYNRTLVLEALEKGADFYRRRRCLSNENGGDLAAYLRDNKDDDDYSIASDTSTNAHYGDNTRFYSTWNDDLSSTSSICFWSNDSRKSETRTTTNHNHHHADDDDDTHGTILNLSDLSLQKQTHYSTTLLSHRRSLYLHHRHALSSLRREISLLQTEERTILRDINQRRLLMKKLHARNDDDDDADYLSRSIKEKFEEYNKMERNYDFKIGITRIDSYNMTRYLNEVMDERRRLEGYWERYYRGVFGEVDERIRRVLGDSALRCCRNMQNWS